MGIEDADIRQSDRLIKNEEHKISNFVSKLQDIHKLLNDYDESIDWESQYKDVKERELTEEEKEKRKKN